jgi:NAD(P)-dependent dehydrogenase (short-subunit alcohol dehydrogenase family)
VNFTGGLAQLVADKGIRVNSVAPGPVWTPLIPATMPNEQVTQFGQKYPIKRPTQPAEFAPVAGGSNNPGSHFQFMLLPLIKRSNSALTSS